MASESSSAFRPPPSAFPRRIAVIGGGISGLAAAHRVRELLPEAECVLFEAGPRVGGVLETVRRGDYLVERSADMFTTRDPWALDLCRRVGLADELIETDPRYRRAFVVRRGKLHPIPEGFMLLAPSKFGPMAATPLLSAMGKMRMLGEYFIKPRRDDADESLASFVRRRLGNEAFERLIQPLVGGIYTADPEKLSMAAALPQFVEMERKFGGILRAVMNRKTPAKEKGSSDGGARYSQFVAPRLGMSQLVDAVAAKLPAGLIRLNARVTSIVRDPVLGRWSLMLQDHAEAETFDDLIYALPGHAGDLLSHVDAVLGTLLAQIPHAGCSVVAMGVKRSQLDHPLDGTGFVVPAIEKRRIIAGSFSSVKFPGRAPSDRVILRTFIGGALQPDLARLPDDELIRVAREELGDLLKLRGEAEFVEVARWLGVMPQYHVSHVQLVDKILGRAAEIPHFALAGNAYRGVGVPFCIRSGEQAAERIVGHVFE